MVAWKTKRKSREMHSNMSGFTSIQTGRNFNSGYGYYYFRAPVCPTLRRT